MFRTIIASFILVASSAVGSAATCGAPAISNVAVKNVDTVGNLNHYQISGTVVNNGPAQASNVLQSVDIYQGTQKLDTRSVPPLKSGESYTFTYTADRASDARSAVYVNAKDSPDLSGGMLRVSSFCVP